MAEGTVSVYDREAGWGTIVPDDGGPPVRVHQVEIRSHGDQVLERGERVAFGIEQDDDGAFATDVTPLGPILSEEDLARLGLVPEPEPAGDDAAADGAATAGPAADCPEEPEKLPTWMSAVIALLGSAALVLLVIGVFQVSDGNDAWLAPLIVSGVVLTVLQSIPHERW
ncbi:cold-shock protein [Promicromonospora sukumoe]|uniref:cold-shock protein n=1 Tax=Promicromonospora sukumoe TaxID=88382 RepID=UPI0037C9D31D